VNFRNRICAVAVRSDHRRRRIGSAVMREFQQRLAERGCLKGNLHEVASNAQAVKFYETPGHRVEE
jgi:ribosomal protein S18 acetylase RimI-like enzyme